MIPKMLKPKFWDYHGNVKVGIGYSASNLLVYDFDSQMECDQ
jgi:hypothetical protein